MRNFSLIFFALCSGISCFSQIRYERGYFIDNNDKKTQCFILNDEPKDNPTKIKYKLDIENDFLVSSLAEIKEFDVSGNKYIRSNVQLDKSSQDIKKLSDSRVPEWVDRQVFLKVIVDGKADLFYYSGEQLVLFFFRVDDLPIEQLVYKDYSTNASKSIVVPSADQKLKPGTTTFSNIATNLTYINQLNTTVSCKNLPQATFKNIQYKGDALTRYFIKFNKCVGVEFVSHENNFKNKFHLSFRPGVDFSTARIDSYFGLIKEFPSRTPRFRVGAEAEFTLPFKKGKWGIILEPTYQSYGFESFPQLNYKSIEIPFGLRHYFFLGENSKIFINGAAVFDFPLVYSIEFKNATTFNSKTIKTNFAVGLGYSYKKYSIEGRYYSLRTGFDETSIYYFDFVKSSIIVGYKIF